MNNLKNWTLLGWTDAYSSLQKFFNNVGLSLNSISTNDFINKKELLPESNMIIATTFKNYPHNIKQYLIDNFYKVLESKISYLSNPNIIFISSASVYGLSNSKLSFMEESKINIENKYSYEKILFENLLDEICNSVNGKCIILRPSGLFGKFELLEKANNLIDRLYKSLITNQVIELEIEYGGNQLRDFLHLYDLFRVICHVSINIEFISKRSNTEIYNVSNNKIYTIDKIIKIAKLHNKKIKANFINNSSENIHSTLNNTKLINSFDLGRFRQIEDYLKIN